MPRLYKDELQKNHFAPFFSKSTFIVYSLLLMTIILPLILIIRTHSKCLSNNCANSDFWITDSFVYEQPNVTHLNEMIVVVYTTDRTYSFGTTSELNELLGTAQSLSPVVEITPFDTSNDGRTDQINVDIFLKNIVPSEIKSVCIVQSLRYGLTDTVEADFKLPIFNMFQTPFGFSNLRA